ncbi:MAG: ACP phosphodiesterase [Nevskiales bacterium]|nr:ACP phosphodiesterase [Nevskiales bacterium]
MNFLAHLWLAEQAGVPLAGAILGDRLHGPLPRQLPCDLALSVRLHRRIDAETDRHPHVQTARAHFAPGARRYAGILLDLIFDHALALDWSRYSREPLADFAHRAAQAVTAQGHWFAPTGTAPAARPFSALLQSYRTEIGLEYAIRRTARRLSKPQGLLDAMQGWRRHLPRLRTEDFPVLLEDLRSGAIRFVQTSAVPVQPASASASNRPIRRSFSVQSPNNHF